MSDESDDIRNLANQVDNLARGHRAFSMVRDIFRNLHDHLISRALVIELRKKDD